MNIRTGRTFALVALLTALALPMAAFADGSRSGGSRAGSGSSGSYRGHGGHSGNHGGYRGHSGGYRGYSSGYRGYRGYYGGYSGFGWYGYPGWGYYGGYGGYGYYGSPGWGYTAVYPVAGAAHGALDLDVQPESAQIYVDGDLVGTADDFDGFPDFLWLAKGTYDVVIFAPGFQTISRQYSIYGGLVIDVEDSMVPGQETLPQDLVSKQTVNRDERLRRDRENAEQARAYEESPMRDSAAGERGEAAGDDSADRLDARGEPGSLKLAIVPDDASVYLDGRFLGTGRELARLRAGLIVDPGEHRIEVVRPGRQSEEKSFSVRAGEEIRLEIELDED
jgi:hypothetical protein